MPPKGRKRGATSAKSGSNGIVAVKSKPNGVEEEFPAIEKIIEEKIEATKSGKGRKKAIVAESKEELEDIPVLGEEKLDDEVSGELKKADGDDVPEDSEEEVPSSEAPEKNGSAKEESEVGSTDSEPEKVAAGKRGRKKAVALPVVAEEETESSLGKRGRKKAVVPETDEASTTEAKEEPEKVAGKRGRKKAAVTEVVEEEVAEPEKTVGRRGRKKAVVVEDEEEVPEDKEEPEKAVGKRGRKKAVVVEDDAKEEHEKAVGRRGRKKAAVVQPVEVDILDSNEEPEKVSGKRDRKKSEEDAEQDEEEEEEHAPPPAKRNTKPGATKKDDVAEEDDTEDFVPRKTRGGRNIKEVAAAPVAKGRKRKVVEEKAEVKQSKKGKALEEIAEEDLEKVDEDRQVKIILKRDHDIDEMARSSLEDDKDDTKVKAGKGPAKSGRKRANQDAEESKPDKVQKEEPAKAKAGSKKTQIPDVTALDFESTSKTPGGKPWNFKIASWNVNGVRAWLEKNGLSYLHHEKPDILCVQETKCSMEKLPEELEVEGYHCHWLAGDKDGYSGVGLLSKVKPLNITDGIGIEEHDGEGRAITAEYEDFYLVTSYVPNSGRGLVRLDYRKKWDEDFRAYLKTLDEKKPVVLCGDLNVSHEEIDIANPKTNKKTAGFTQEERDGFSALLKEGFVDTFRELYPDTKDAYTFWTYITNARVKNIGWRLDYFVISERFKDHLCDSLIRKEVFGSDHCPVALLLHI